MGRFLPLITHIILKFNLNRGTLHEKKLQLLKMGPVGKNGA
jgi:hypothetical protein